MALSVCIRQYCRFLAESDDAEEKPGNVPEVGRMVKMPPRMLSWSGSTVRWLHIQREMPEK